MPQGLVAEPSPSATPVRGVTPETLAAVLAGLAPPMAAWVRALGFAAGAGEVALVPAADGAPALALFGLGAQKEPSLVAGKLPGALPAGTYRLDGGFPDVPLAALAFALGAYRFTRYREASGAERRLVVPPQAGDVPRIAEGVFLARDLVNTGANDLGPAELADAAAALAARHGAVVRQTVGEALLAQNFPLVHAVGRAATAARAPRLVDLTWGDASRPKITLVGKGVTFDTGGLDIKPSSGMLLMKKDMGGAANALGLAHMIMDAGLPVRLRVLIPAVENAISADAFRPGDVLTARSGLTVEIGNTDAEGRLVLADALALAAEEKPALVVDLATLTGAARTALGPEVVPVYSRHDAPVAEIVRHGERVADPLWRLPLWQPYMAMLDSKVADINNAGSGPFAGSITAALFLSRFVPEAVPWLHADIYAWNPSTKPGRPEGGEAQAIRALFAWLAERYRA